MSGLPARITAVLGPTNTGKTHYAIDRMLGYKTGIMGLPLRLLAREVYDKIVSLRGPSVVGLVTGEERIVPPRVQYWVCTVEAMPQGLGTDFVAIDEVQLCADPERGHVFTDRLLRMRGTHETLFLGADTMRGPIAQLEPKAQFMRRERMSTLSYTGPKKTSRMPPRSAIVGFSVDSVYGIAELLRRQKGGAAVVMGALSPRTRNAQVEMYQNGDVDYLVATDAIGMGLNLDVHHVAFSGLNKFDGRRMRHLMPHELAQIAGRAGRHTNDGTFGVTGEADPLEPEVVQAIEDHRFAPIKRLQWRNARLEFGTVDALLRSLEAGSDDPILVRAREAEDHRTLATLADQPSIRARLGSARDVRLLWDTCQIPDFRQVSPGEHADLVSKIFEFLHQDGEIPQGWLTDRVGRVDKTHGDIDVLSKRLAFVRTWTFVSQRKGWVSDESYWRDHTRAVEDRLSDALHSALTQRFVDRRTSVLLRRLKQKEALVADVNDKGEVRIEDQFVGQLNGFRFQLDPSAEGAEAKTLRAAALAALKPQFHLMADRFYNAPDTEFDITEQGGLMWGEHAVGKLVKGSTILSPEIAAFVDEEAGVDIAEKVKRRLGHFVTRRIDAAFEPLLAMQKDETITGLARGVSHRLVEALGVLPRSAIAEDVKALDQDARGLLRKCGIRFGQYTIFQHLMLKPAPTRLRLVLWGLFEDMPEFPEAPPPGLVTIPVMPAAARGYYPRAGYRLAGERAIRIDMLERLADLVRTCDVKEGFEANADMLSISGTTLEQFADLMGGLGYDVQKGERQKAAKPEVKPEPKAALTEDPTADPAEEPGPATPEVPQVATATAPETAKGEAEQEVFYTFKWIPRRGGGRTDRQDDQNQGRSARRGKGKGKNKPPQTRTPSKPKPKKDKPIDPDNPFAALMALKNKS